MAQPGGIRIRIIEIQLASQMAITTTRLLRTTVMVTAWGTLDADNSIYNSNICLATGQGESQECGYLFGALF
jgi:hypothetical protein